MGEAVLLTGLPGCGKTTLIRRVVAALPFTVGGFYTGELREGGARVGFEIVTFDGHTGTLAHVNIASSVRVGRYGVDLPALDTLAVSSIRDALQHAALLVVDEIGPMELASEAFRAAVLAALDSPIPVFGSIVRRSTPFSDFVKARPGVTLVEVTPQNRDALAEQLIPRLQALAQPPES